MTKATDSPRIFDRARVRQHRARATGGPPGHDFLFREVAARLAERLGAVNRSFSRILLLGARGGSDAYSFGTDSFLVTADLSEAIVAGQPGAVVLDEEHLPLAPESLDLVISNLSLHWVNDLPGALIQIRRALKPDGLFLGAMFGGNTLQELRHALMHAELEIRGGATPRISPFADIRDLGHLLQRAGFALPVTDTDEIPVSYSDTYKLMLDLRAMGEASALTDGGTVPLSRAALTATEAAYRANSSIQADEGGEDGRLTATFQVIYLTGWAPHPDQPKPLKPGSAEARMADALGTRERRADE